MRRFSDSYRLLALAGLLSLASWGCTTDSPTAPRQEIPPIPPTGQAYFLSVTSEPGGIVISDTAPSGNESATITVDVRLNGPGGPLAPDGTTIEVNTSLGSFSNLALVRSVGVEVFNGQAFLTLFAGGTPVQLGVATVQALRGGNIGQALVPISVLEASFVTSNPELNLSVQFTDTSVGNPTDFFWDFGDGETSTLQNPNHEFPAGGTYQVKLTVSKTVAGTVLSDSATQAVSVTAPL